MANHPPHEGDDPIVTAIHNVDERHHKAVGLLRELGFDAPHEHDGKYKYIWGCVCPDCIAHTCLVGNDT